LIVENCVSLKPTTHDCNKTVVRTDSKRTLQDEVCVWRSFKFYRRGRNHRRRLWGCSPGMCH